MATPLTISATNPATDVAQVDSAKSATGSTGSTSIREQTRATLNVSIVQASLDVSISSKNEPMSLLLKSAVDALNKELAPTLGDNAIQNAASQDNTPEGTAGRIVSMSTGFFEAYKARYPNLSNNEAISQFMKTIRGGFEKGFQEASNILQGLGVLNGDIATNIQKTYALVQQGYADFEAANTTPTTPAASAADATAKTATTAKA
ncbi:MAG TPA: DUF5610 domain-containing protein [Rhodocyclaceae bacterium]|jgi:hypothetical protein